MNHSTSRLVRSRRPGRSATATPSDITKPAPIARDPVDRPLAGRPLAEEQRERRRDERQQRRSATRAATNQPAPLAAAWNPPLRAALPLEQVHFVDVDRGPVAEEQDDDREPDPDLGRRDGDHEQREDLLR